MPTELPTVDIRLACGAIELLMEFKALGADVAAGQQLEGLLDLLWQ